MSFLGGEMDHAVPMRRMYERISVGDIDGFGGW